MISIKVQNSTDRKEIVVDPATNTPKDVFTAAEIPYEGGIIQLDGCTLNVKDMNTTLANLGITESAILVATIKTTNAR